MRIGIDLTTFRSYYQGTETYSENLVKSLVRLGGEHSFVIFKNKNVLPELDELEKRYPNVKIVLNDPTRLVNNSFSLALYQQLKLPFIVRKERLDLIFSTSPFFSIFSPAKKIVVIHDCAYKRFKEFRGFMSAAYIRLMFWAAKYFCEKIITVSKFSKQELIDFYRFLPEKIKVIYEGPPAMPQVEIDFTAKVMDKYSIQRRFFFFVGISRKRKNIDGLLKAFRIFTERSRKDAILVLAGKIENQFVDVDSLIKELKLEKNVIRVGFVKPQEKAVFYKTALALLFPSFYEGFGLPVLEAQSSGIPVLTSNVSSLPEVAGSGALYVNPNDIEDIARGIEKIGFDERFRKETVKKGLENVKKFSWDKTAEEVLVVFREVGLK